MIQTIWKNRFAIFVDIKNQAEANNRYATIDSDVGGIYTFNGLRLSPDGYEPATHCGTNTAATDEMMVKIEEQISLLPLSGLYDILDGSTWDWDGAQMDNHLQVVRPWGDSLPIDNPQLPPWVGQGTHTRCLVLSPWHDYANGSPSVPDVLEEYPSVASHVYGGDNKLAVVAVTCLTTTFTNILNNSHYHIIWSQEV